MAHGVVVVVAFSLFSFYGTSIADLSSEYNHKETLDSNYILHWTHNASSAVMNIAAEVKTSGWVAFGFAKQKSSNMDGYDVCVGFVSGEVMKDYLTNGHTVPKEDPQNDCKLIMVSKNGGTTTLKFQRKVNTGDPKDLPIEKGEILVVWAYKNSDVFYWHDERGFKTLTMIAFSAGRNPGNPLKHWSLAAEILFVLVAFIL